MLIHLNVLSLPVMNVAVRPVYGIGERSGIHVWRFTAQMLVYLTRAFFWRLWERYVLRDFHPLVFFYASEICFSIVGVLVGLYLLAYRILVGQVAASSALFSAFMFVSGWQFLLFAMWFDSEASRRRP